MADFSDKRGVYNIDYFSGSQVAIFIGDVLVDEITSMSYAVHQSRTPIYGYADQLLRDVSKGVVLVQGEFTINFKEAGYLWLVLNRYRALMKGEPTYLDKYSDRTKTLLQRPLGGDFFKDNFLNEVTMEKLMNGELSAFERTKALQSLSAGRAVSEYDLDVTRNTTQSTLLGFASSARAGLGRGSPGAAESAYEAFEDMVWTHDSKTGLDANGSADLDHRRADEPDLNDFDIYVTFGDYDASNHENHTVQKLTNVHIVGSSKQIVIDGVPIQEAYSFIARNII